MDFFTLSLRERKRFSTAEPGSEEDEIAPNWPSVLPPDSENGRKKRHLPPQPFFRELLQHIDGKGKCHYERITPGGVSGLLVRKKGERVSIAEKKAENENTSRESEKKKASSLGPSGQKNGARHGKD